MSSQEFQLPLMASCVQGLRLSLSGCIAFEVLPVEKESTGTCSWAS